MEYTLTKQPKGKNFIYTVKDENGNIKASRVSKRDYVACTITGDYFFGRRDLVGKGDHGRILKEAKAILSGKGDQRNREWAEQIVESYKVVYIQD